MVGLAMLDNLSDGDTHRLNGIIMREWSDGLFQCWDGKASKDTMWVSDLSHVCLKHKVCNYIPVKAVTPDVMDLTQATLWE